MPLAQSKLSAVRASTLLPFSSSAQHNLGVRAVYRREYFHIDERLGRQLRTVFMAKSLTERRRCDRLHQRVVELSFTFSCRVLVVHPASGRMFGTLSLGSLQDFAKARKLRCLPAIFPRCCSRSVELCIGSSPESQPPHYGTLRESVVLSGTQGQESCALFARR